MYSLYCLPTFDRCFLELRDQQAKARIQARIDRAECGHLGDHQAAGEGVYEMRIHCGPGYRVYFFRLGRELMILLAGGDKSAQKCDIAKALKLANELRA